MKPLSSNAPRNVLIVMSDEHRRDAAGFMDHPFVQTPSLDRLAMRGTIFNNAYTPSPICVSARAALATGNYIHRTGNWDSAAPYTGEPKSWMHSVRDTGAEVVSFGKLHFRSSGDDNGFSKEILPMHVLNGIGWTVGLLREDPPRFHASAEFAADVGMGESDYIRYDRAVTQTAVDWLSNRKATDTPWVGFVSLSTPHYPLRAPEEFLRLYDTAKLDMPIAYDLQYRPTHPELRRVANFYDYDKHFSPAKVKQAIASYYGLISFMDNCVGRVLGALENSGQIDETLVIYISDHGDMMGDHGFWAKSVMYEASVGIPMVISGPGVEAGQRISTGVSLLDISATLLDVFDIKSKESSNHNQSLLKVAGSKDNSDRTIFSEYHDGGSSTGTYMVRWGDWKYIHYVGLPPQLFNLETDPLECNDLSSHTDEVCVAALAEGVRRLEEICNPKTESNNAFADQQSRITALGGRDMCLRAQFNHTPTPALN